MRLVVGLGNPGGRYRETRHNVGFAVVDRLAARWGVTLNESRPDAERGSGAVAGVPVVLAKPLTFMNASGEAVARICERYAVEVADVVAVYDDLDLPLARVRVRPGGGAAGHRGVASLIDALGPGFARVRIGIGRPPDAAGAVDFVLEPFTPAERPLVAAAFERAADAVESLLRDGIARAMNAFNGLAAGV